jgi:hypothetical protein
MPCENIRVICKIHVTQLAIMWYINYDGNAIYIENTSNDWLELPQS